MSEVVILYNIALDKCYIGGDFYGATRNNLLLR